MNSCSSTPSKVTNNWATTRYKLVSICIYLPISVNQNVAWGKISLPSTWDDFHITCVLFSWSASGQLHYRSEFLIWNTGNFVPDKTLSWLHPMWTVCLMFSWIVSGFVESKERSCCEMLLGCYLNKKYQVRWCSLGVVLIAVFVLLCLLKNPISINISADTNNSHTGTRLMATFMFRFLSTARYTFPKLPLHISVVGIN